MKGNQLLRKEFTQIIKSKKILIPIIAVLFVPILYAGMFLWAFWDPYKQLDDLPVAVVNLDKGAVFDGKPIEVGKGLVDNLKDNTSFKWEFVSEKEAKKGMEGRKYYMLVRIPDDFSSNATTLLKDDPKPLNLEYIPNESLNFLSSQIGGTAIEKIKGEVSSTLTKTYAEKMFDSIQDVSKGLADGAEGANKLHDGSSELQDGSSKVTDGLHTLQGKSGEMKDGVGKLFDGSGKVTNGLNTLNSKTGEMQIGIGKLVDGSGKVTDGLHVLNSNAGIGKLVDGSGKVTDGLHALNSNAGIGKLVDGSGKVTDGLNTLNSKTSEMQTGIGKLVDGSGKITAGLNTLNSKTGELRDGSEKVTGGLNQLVSKSGELKTGTTDLSNGMGKLAEGQRQLEKGSKEIQKGLQDLNSNVQKSAAGLEEMQSKVPSILNTVNEKIDGAGANVNQLNELTQSTAGDAKNAAQDVANLQKQIESLPKEYQEQLQPFITSAVKSTATVQQKAAGVAGGTNKLNEEVKQLTGEIHQTTNGVQKQLPNPAGVKTLAGGVEKLTNAQNEFVSKFHGFGEGLDNAKIGADKLKDGSVQLIDGVTQLQSGSGKVTAGLGQLSAGVNQLADGSSQVTGGLGQLSAGANQMAGGVNQLADGSSQVTGGLGTLSVGVTKLADGSSQVTGGLGTLSGGVTKLADGSSQVTGGLDTLSAGAGQMSGGITQLADGSGQVTTGLGTLSTGSTQLIDGVNKLADGSGKVTDGLVKVNDGSGELAEKLGEGAEKTGEVKGTDKTYDMFASPVKVKTEKMAEVPNYGTGFTPYFLSLGLFVGALLLSIVYPLRDTVGVPKSGFSWFISKFGVLLSVGIIQAIVADIILLFGLGVEVQSIPYFILFSIVTSLAFIALIQCLVTAFGDAGRFIAIITLIIQLTTSAGTFPLELIPKFLQPFNAWLPMTYSVSGLKAVVSSGDFNFMWQNVGMLMIFIVVLSLGTIASLTWMHKRQFRNIAENQSVEA
ncbi:MULTISPECIES: YhgE/Pip domain-containing protein [Bacillus]|uniref:Phage infection protein n=1 Tax=Bacillus wiedmannii TaxID=1890302 RepID=A0A2B5ICD3_9BACI|nr:MULTISPECIES: YhgE/Pip domain-containing protein [Bacillus]MDF9663271.1 YhgE/Pip domain-containing protein [Bacillus wiedmannii]MDI6505989.1 YhgE/Pip domain-containing protein [Bacillus wiedmannii]MDI6510678.1 YhgE/Pip domain-containing protein [Bacillus wiedmannii]PFZ22245.1 phage infection protein [Bacillus wiedmannii]PGC21748.1 phage infection protein [Bacillus wiedmannii]